MSDRATLTTRTTPPLAEPRPHQATYHGKQLNDPYHWLRADNWQEVMRAPDTLPADIRDYLEAENSFTASVLGDTQNLQDQLFEEMKARIKQDDSTVPTPDGPFEYFYRYVPGEQYPQLCRQPRNSDDMSVILDGNKEAEGLTYWSMGGTSHSPDHKWLAYSTDTNGSETYTIKARDLETGTDRDDEIGQAQGTVVWANDNAHFYYVRLDENHRPLSVYRHKLGTPSADDVLIYQEADTAFYVGLSKTQSSRFVMVEIHDHQTSEVHLLDADAPETTELTCVAPRQEGHEYDVEHNGDRLIIRTNSDSSEDFRIVEAPITAPSPENWSEVLAHQPGRLILSHLVLAHHMIRLERFEGLPRIVITNLKDTGEHAISFDEEAYGLGMSDGYEYDTTNLRFTYSSMTTPAEVYDYDVETRQRTLRKRQEVPSGHDPKDYITRRIQAPTPDGETVPISLLYAKGTPIDGSAPLLLYGYGAYGISIPSSFSTGRLSLVGRGFIYAIAHIRGGKDKGYRWYKDGKLANKTNTFTDFIAAGEHLADQNYTTRGAIVAHGGSAGGMLMGAVANMAPDLFKGIIANVPFVDVLNTMLDKDLPLTPPEWLEWGNPIATAEEFERIQSYSPYDCVTAQAYPHIFALAGLTDPRVTYWEPAKWIARLRTMNTSDNMILLKTNMGAGHGGASGRFDALKEVAMEYAFALKIAGKTDPATS
ncbi:MAG: S9 family peptidase [Pseudomonadota bacterium]